MGYELSYIEFFGVITGLLGLYLATREKTLNWPINLLSILCFFAIFYQVNLYAEMIFQVYFFSVGIYGWATWHQENKNNESSMTYLSMIARVKLIIFVIIATLLLAFAMTKLPEWLPHLFPTADPYPITDAFISIASITAMTLLAKKKIENWLLWIIVNLISAILYAKQHILFASFEYLIFLAMVIFGFFSWKNYYKEKHQKIAS